MWRKHETHAQETKAVKAALRAAGLPVVGVGHGTGTAWGWLKIRLASLTTPHDRSLANGSVVKSVRGDANWGRSICVGNCGACREYRERYSRTCAVAQEATGRHGEYGGEISVY